MPPTDTPDDPAARAIPVQEAAARFGVGRSTIFHWMTDGLLRRYRRRGDRRTYVDPVALQELLRTRAVD